MFKLRAWAKKYIKNYTLGSADEWTKNYINTVVQAYKKSERRVETFKKFYNETEEYLDKQIEATYNMYKENTELKEQVSALSKALVLNTSDEKLEKAKALIDRFLDFESYAQERGCYIADDTRKQAEQFLKEANCV